MGCDVSGLESELSMSVPHEHVMQFFSYAHLPDPLQKISKPFCELAHHIEQTTPRNPERSVALRKLLEAKDAAVRAHISAGPDQLPNT